jgi:hypothetical protein
VQIASAIEVAMDSHPLEKPYLEDRLETVSKMIEICFSSDVMNSEDNQLKVLSSGFYSEEMNSEDNQLKVLSSGKSKKVKTRKLSKEQLRAKCFKVAPLETCFRHQFLPLFGTRQVK